MGVISIIELLKGISDPVAAQTAKDIITADELSGFLPFFPIPNDVVTFTREKALPAAVTPSSGATLTEDNAFEESRVSAFVRRFIIDQAIDNLDAAAGGGRERARNKAVMAAVKSLSRKYGDLVVTGNSNWTVTTNSNNTGATSVVITVGPGHDTRMPMGTIRYTHSGTLVQYKAATDAEFGAAVTVSNGVKVYSDSKDKWVTFGYSGAPSQNGDINFTISVTGSSTPIDGILRLVAASQVIDASGTNGDALTFKALDQLADQVTDTSGEKVYIMNRRTRRSYAALCRDLGGAEPTVDIYPEQFGGGVGAEKIPTYNGKKILVSDWLPLNRSKGSLSDGAVVICATIGEDAGLCGFYSTAGEQTPGVVKLGANGLVAEIIESLHDRDASKVRVKGYWGLKNASEKGLAMLDNITN